MSIGFFRLTTENMLSINSTANNGHGPLGHQRPTTSETEKLDLATNERPTRTLTKERKDGLCGNVQKSPRTGRKSFLRNPFRRWSPPAKFPDPVNDRDLSRNMTTSKSVKLRSSNNVKRENLAVCCCDEKLRLMCPVLYLSTSQVQSVQNTWRYLKEHHGERAIEQILQKLVNDQPKIKDFFYQAAFLNVLTRATITTFRDHARLIYRSIDDLIENIDNRSRCCRVLKEFRHIGSKHAFMRKSGFKPDTWEKFGEAAVEVINGFDCVKANTEAAKAWTIVIASVTDELRIGFEAEARKQNYGFERPRSACE